MKDKAVLVLCAFWCQSIPISVSCARRREREEFGKEENRDWQRWTVCSHFPWQTSSTLTHALMTRCTTLNPPFSSSSVLFVLIAEFFRAAWTYKYSQPFCWHSLKLLSKFQSHCVTWSSSLVATFLSSLLWGCLNVLPWPPHPSLCTGVSLASNVD